MQRKQASCIMAPDATALEHSHFSSLNTVFKLIGERVTGGNLNEVIRYQTSEGLYYIKRYFCGGKGLRCYLGTSRARREWLNLQYFKKLRIPCAEWVVVAEEHCLGVHGRAILITRAIPDSVDLITLFERNDPLLKDPVWRFNVGKKIMTYIGRLHNHGFVHGDLKWRNILVSCSDPIPSIYFIDCPQGKKVSKYRFHHERIKDLACLAKRAPFVLTRHEQVNLLKIYCEQFTQAPLYRTLACQVLAEQYNRYDGFYG